MLLINDRTIRVGDNCCLAVLSRIAAVYGGDSIWSRHVLSFALNGSDERARAIGPKMLAPEVLLGMLARQEKTAD